MTASGYGELYDDLDRSGHLGNDPAARDRGQSLDVARQIATLHHQSRTPDPLPDLTDTEAGQHARMGEWPAMVSQLYRRSVAEIAEKNAGRKPDARRDAQELCDAMFWGQSELRKTLDPTYPRRPLYTVMDGWRTMSRAEIEDVWRRNGDRTPTPIGDLPPDELRAYEAARKAEER